MDVSFPSGTTYILVIDTDSYAGKFERQLAGYCTGVVDEERYHGTEEAQDACEASPDLTASMKAKSLPLRHAEYGWVTNTIRATPGRLNNGMGFHYDDGDPDLFEEARRRSKDAMREYQSSQIAMCEQRLADQDFDEKLGWTKEGCERTIQSALASIERAGDFVKFPAYESVAVFFRKPLDEAEMAFVRERAYEYAAHPITRFTKPFHVLDIYMLQRTPSDNEERFAI